jgi:hypothetical protein
MAAFADPLTGWADRDVTKHAPLAKEDAYGSMFFYLRHTLQQFYRCLRKVQLKFHLLRADAKELPRLFKGRLENELFDSIEVRRRTKLIPQLTGYRFRASATRFT